MTPVDIQCSREQSPGENCPNMTLIRNLLRVPWLRMCVVQPPRPPRLYT